MTGLFFVLTAETASSVQQEIEFKLRKNRIKNRTFGGTNNQADCLINFFVEKRHVGEIDYHL